jgi:tRNA(adenine34) deaminase
MHTILAMPIEESKFMAIALEEARAAEMRGEVPVGACIVDEAGTVVARAGNRTIELSDPTAHAEMLAIRIASDITGNYRLGGLTMFSTLEPCVMCAGAIVNSRLPRIVFAARDERYGAVRTLYNLCDDPQLNHRLTVEEGMMAEESRQILKNFFKSRRS